MGIARLPGSRGSVLLTRLGRHPDEIVRESERLAVAGSSTDETGMNARPSGNPVRAEPTPAVRRAIDAAYAEVDAVGGSVIGSDFLLVGLLVEGRGLAADVLRRAGVTLEGARAALDSGDPPSTAGAPLSPRPDVPPGSTASNRRERVPRFPGMRGVVRTDSSATFRMARELRQVLGLRREEARRLGASDEDTEHVLLAIAHSPECDAARVLRNLGIDLATVAREVERAVPQPGADAVHRSDGRPSDAMLRVIHAARAEWKVSRREMMSSTDLLLGLLAEGTGIAATVLNRLGVTLERVRSALSSGDSRGSGFRMEIDDRSTLSIYEQIIARVQEAIATGLLEPGDRLPPVRQLADSLDIAPGTVARAYSELEARRVVVTEGARGTRVADQDRSALSSDARRATLIELLRPVAVEAFHLGASSAELHAALDAATGDIRPERGTA